MAKIPGAHVFIAVFLIAGISAAHSPTQSPSSLPLPPPSTMGPAAAPGPGLDCVPYLMNLTDCLTYVMNGSTSKVPDKGCCSELGNLVETQPLCLCQLLGHPEKAVGFSIDFRRALHLPAVCKVSTPPVSMCSAFGVPVAAPGPNLAPSPGTSSSSGEVPSQSPGIGIGIIGPSSDGTMISSPGPAPGADLGAAAKPNNSAHSFHTNNYLLILLPIFMFSSLF